MASNLFIILAICTAYISACKDTSQYCAIWKLSGYCDPNDIFFSFMKINCPVTCNTCPPPPNCFDKGSYCSSYKPYCGDPSYKDYLIDQCKLTCNYCHFTTTASTTTYTKPYTAAGGRALQPGCGHKGPGQTRIVGGTNAKPGAWPWIANIDYKYNKGNPGHHCGGTLITEEWVLSAAHCFDDRKKEHYWLKLGEHDIKNPSQYEQQFNFSQLIIHPNYNSKTYDFDLALIRLHKNASISQRVRTACLPDYKTTFPSDTECYISGWGLLSSYGVGPAILQQAKVPLVDQNKCNDAYSKLSHSITSQMFCAGFSNGTIDSCQGDSGGPLVCKQKGNNDIWYLWGTISWGVGCARQGLYGVYASPLAMRRWIDSIVFKI